LKEALLNLAHHHHHHHHHESVVCLAQTNYVNKASTELNGSTTYKVKLKKKKTSSFRELCTVGFQAEVSWQWFHVEGPAQAKAR